ncbi:MAG: hypothetical protein H7311_06755 [Ramlibacter sp.]|nr:hypothetical protein [Cryobacterium sp.]
MKIPKRLRALGTLAVTGALVLSGGPAMAAVSSHSTPVTYTCTGGDIPSGSYASITVTGVCNVPADAVISVVGNVNVAAGAVLDAQSAPSTITVGRNVTGAAGSLVGLGCQPPSYTGNSAHPCTAPPDGHSTITINGDVTVTDAVAVLLNGITIRGNVTLIGGGSDIPWSIKNNKIGKNATLTGIALSDIHPGAPGVYIVRNTIGQNLNCTGLTPAVSGGFIPGSVNVVGRNATGQCAALI